MFDPTFKQQTQAREFMDNHECSLENDQFGGKKIGAIGGRWTWSFTPTSIGLIVKIKCACGAEEDLTDCSDW